MEAARTEALAAIRELSDARTGGNSRRWAGWFLQLADEQGQFFRAPIGHPALELATPQRPADKCLVGPATSVTSLAWEAAAAAPTQVAELVRDSPHGSNTRRNYSNTVAGSTTSFHPSARITNVYGRMPASSWPTRGSSQRKMM